MLGWFALRPDTSIEDAEWLLARAAGFDAGFALAASLASTAQLEADPNSAEAAKQFGATPAILASIRQWETARMGRAFPPEIKARLCDNTREFHLQSAGPGQWDLFEARFARFAHDASKPVATELHFTNTNLGQPLQWTLTSTSKQPLPGVVVEINGQLVLDLKERALPPGGSLKYSAGPEAVIYSPTWKELARVPVEAGAARVSTGTQPVKISCASQSGAALKIELRTLGPATRLGARQAGGD
jgi:hypothetical protein